MSTEKAYKGVDGRLEPRGEFYIHLAIYVVVSVLLVAVSLQTSPEYFWAKWPLIGWGIGVFFHAVRVFMLAGRR